MKKLLSSILAVAVSGMILTGCCCDRNDCGDPCGQSCRPCCPRPCCPPACAKPCCPPRACPCPTYDGCCN